MGEQGEDEDENDVQIFMAGTLAQSDKITIERNPKPIFRRLRREKTFI